jgi:hypothetical protein
MPTRILGIHGIAQQYVSGPELTRTWCDALRGGLELSGNRTQADALAETDVRVAFFGDLFRPPGAKAGGQPPYTPADLAPGLERELLERWYAAAVERDPSLGPSQGSKGPGRVAAQTMLERLLRSRSLSGVAQRAFIGNLKQVTAFLLSPTTREQVLARVAGEIRPETRVVIGHSLGSVVAYEYLAQVSLPQVELLVTLGSPLGIPNLVFERLTPAPSRGMGAWPGSVPRWVNVADANDVVALRKQLAPLFPARDGNVPLLDRVVDNGDEPHAITRYLNARPTGEALGAVL